MSNKYIWMNNNLSKSLRARRLLSKMGLEGYAIFHYLVIKSVKEYVDNPKYPIVINKNVFKRDILSEIFNLDYFREIFKIVEWPYTETGAEFHFNQNKEAYIFEYNHKMSIEQE